MAIEEINVAKKALIEAKDLTDILEIRDRATAMQAYASAKGADEASQLALEIKLRAERKAGIFLKEQPKAKGGNPNLTSDNMSPVVPTLSDLGVTKKESSRWQKIADIPEEKFEEFINNTAKKTQSALLAEAKRQSMELHEPIEPPKLPEGIYDVIYADPPWQYNFSETYSRSIPAHYPEMSLSDVGKIKVPVAENAVLFLWATNPKLEEAFDVIFSWGFEYKTNLVWVKDKIGMGYWVRGQHELLLIATKGNFPTPEPSIRRSSVLESPRTKHSAKPTEVYEMIEEYFPNGRYLELFSRNQREGWTMWGNETDP